MNKPTSILIILLFYAVGIWYGDCTAAVVVAMFLLPAAFERNRKRRVNK